MSSLLIGTDIGIVGVAAARVDDIDDILVALDEEYMGSSVAVMVVDKDEDVMVDMGVV